MTENDRLRHAPVDAALAGDPFTEDALALRFSERHEHDLRTLPQKRNGSNGTMFAGALNPRCFARDSCRTDAKDYGNGKCPASVSSAKTVAAVERFAKADRRQAATLEQFDADDSLLTTENQTVNLCTGLERPPDPADYITKKTTCSATPAGTPHPLWTAFLDRITAGNVELQQFLQRYVGYCLTGITSEHKFVFAYGTGANGKGTFINTIAKILGDYATVADVGTFLASNQERHPTDIAKLHGAHLVVAQETDKGRRWDEAKIKTMTGGDVMTGRFMRCDYFDFVPKFKLFITGNHKPRLDSVDEAMRRRLLIVPFTVQIPVEERDTDLPEKLKAEWPAILRWMIDGCLEWQRLGLAPPKIVTDATDAYFDDQDVIRQWLDDCTEGGGPFAFVRSSELFASWKQWCDDRGIKTGSLQALQRALVDRGFTQKRMTQGRGFSGLSLKGQAPRYDAL